MRHLKRCTYSLTCQSYILLCVTSSLMFLHPCIHSVKGLIIYVLTISEYRNLCQYVSTIYFKHSMLYIIYSRYFFCFHFAKCTVICSYPQELLQSSSVTAFFREKQLALMQENFLHCGQRVTCGG
jgi:hypothetical protein